MIDRLPTADCCGVGSEWEMSIASAVQLHVYSSYAQYAADNHVIGLNYALCMGDAQ